MSIPVKIATVHNGQAVISSATTGAPVAFCSVLEAILICTCQAVDTGGSFTLTVEGSVDGSTGWYTLATFGTVGTPGALSLARVKQTPNWLRWRSADKAGTSITATIIAVGMVPVDSTLADAL